MIKRRGCLYNGAYIGIENFYNVIDGKKINVDNGILEKFRVLGRNNELYCPCGCGANLVIVAGQNQIRSQHFKIKNRTKDECCIEEENIISVYSKVIINCWLKDKLQLSFDDIACRVKINEISESDRKYELSAYVQKRNLGVVYTRKYHNIDNEKMKVLLGISDVINTLYICDIGKENDIEAHMGQYPEFLNKIQNIQGYCIFLNLKNIDNQAEMYKETEIIIKYNIKDDIGLWKKLEVIKGTLSEFTIDSKGLVYKDMSVSELVEKTKKAYYEEKERIREQIRQVEQERLKREQEEEVKRKKLMEEEEEREEQRQLFLEEEKKRKKEQEEENRKKYNEEYEVNYKKSVNLYKFISTLEWIEGSFFSKQSNGFDREYKRRVVVNSVTLDKKLHRIVIHDNVGERYLIYVKENGYKTKGCTIGSFYVIADFENIEETNVIQLFKEYFLCMSKTKNINLEMKCTLENTECPYIDRITRKCNFTSSMCSFRKHMR